jgi:hypothetical protein
MDMEYFVPQVSVDSSDSELEQLKLNRQRAGTFEWVNGELVDVETLPLGHKTNLQTNMAGTSWTIVAK